MQLRHFMPHPMLRGNIDKIWVYRSSGRIPQDDMKLIVPNGRIKLVLPSHNVVNIRGLAAHVSQKDIISLVGITDMAGRVNDEQDDPSGTIGIEFSPQGAYRFFRINQDEIRNQMHPLRDVLGIAVRQLEEQMINMPGMEAKVDALQQFLLSQFLKQSEDNVLDYCINRINASKGAITIRELEKETGYSSRWLNMKFLGRVGLSPKNFSAVIRFHGIYQYMASNPAMPFDQKYFYQYYYDQSHFIRDFKRFTGIAPGKLARSSNEFGKLFFKE